MNKEHVIELLQMWIEPNVTPDAPLDDIPELLNKNGQRRLVKMNKLNDMDDHDLFIDKNSTPTFYDLLFSDVMECIINWDNPKEHTFIKFYYINVSVKSFRRTLSYVGFNKDTLQVLQSLELFNDGSGKYELPKIKEKKEGRYYELSKR